MENKIYYSNLFDCYEGLLTEKQKRYFEDYFIEDLSLGEISENYEVSRNAAYNQIKETIKKLNHYEEVLKIYQRNEKIKDLIKQIDENVKKEIESLL